MINQENRIAPNGTILLFLTGINILILEAGYTSGHKWYWALALTVPMLLLAILKKHHK